MGRCGLGACRARLTLKEMKVSGDYQINQIISTRGEFLAALHAAFAEAARVGCRDLMLCDPTFADWPLGDAAVIEHLGRWVRPHRRLTLLAHEFGELARLHARWVAWRRVWSHLVVCRSNPEIEPADLPTLLVASDLLAVRLVDPMRWRGSVSRRPVDVAMAHRQLDVILQRLTDAFPATVAGL